jgi:hypothetical protein
MQTQPPLKTGSVWKAILGWLLILATTFGLIGLWLWFESKKQRVVVEEDGAGFPLFLFAFGFLSVVAGIAAYFIVLRTNCFLSDFRKPMWNEMKSRIYLANVFVPLLVMMGIGFMLSLFLTPRLRESGVSASMAFFLPVMGCIAVMQVVLVWFVLWAPVEKSFIRKRLLARGVSENQLQTGTYIGISNPDKSSMKKFSCVEEDMGMLWLDAWQLIYWGDGESFTIGRDDLLEVQRQVDGASTTALSGTAHVVLRVRQPGGGERRLRLHCEGIGTLGGKRVAMNALAERIAVWRSTSVTSPPPVPNS